MHEKSKEALELKAKAECLAEFETQDSRVEALGLAQSEANDEESAELSANDNQESATMHVLADAQQDSAGIKNGSLQAGHYASIIRRFTALFIDSLIVSVISATVILILTLLSSNFNYPYHYAFYGTIFPISICISLLSAFVPWLSLFNIAEVYKMVLADPAHFGHMPEVGLAWTVASLNIVLNLAYHTLLTSSRMNATLGQKWLGMRVLAINGSTVTLVSAFMRSALKLVIWTYCSLFYWALVAMQFTQVLDFILSIPAAWILSVVIIACLDRLKMLHGAKYLLEQFWQKASSTETFLNSSAGTKAILMRPKL